MSNLDETVPFEARQLLIIEDDAVFARTLGRSFERRGYTVFLANNFDAAKLLVTQHAFGFAVVDLILIVVLTGFASIVTVVEAIKLGACQYLAKPSNTDDIEAAFGNIAGKTDVSLTNRSTSIKTLEWEHIHDALRESNFNISEAARRLGMHRRTLARKLEKQRVK